MARHTKIAGPIVFLLALLLALPNAALAASFTLTPAQPSVGAGQTISFIGTGFTRGERVAIWATAPDQTVIGGDFEFAEGDAGFISKTPVIATFEVQGRDPATAVPQAAVAPTSGAPGAQFAFSALGFKTKEKVSYWFTGPDGAIHDAYPEGDSANSHGRVDLSWRAPADAVHGTWVITIQGLKSGVARGVPFEIR